MQITNEEPFYSYSKYLKSKYGISVYRVGVDAGFSCPNRGNNRKNPGCTYCDEAGSRAPYLGKEEEIKKQVDGAIAFLRKRYGAKLYILYFQAFTNTFAPVQKLKNIYDYGLSLAPFKELIVSTRPDCINKQKAQLLASYHDTGIDVWVELGLQSANDKTLKLINRGHDLKSFERAYRILKKENLKVAVHVIFGLPGENMEDIMHTIDYLAKLQIDGIKIHNIHVPIGTKLFEESLMGEIPILSHFRHLKYVIEALTRLPAKTVIMRITTDTVKNKLALPKYFLDKASFYNRIRQTMLKNKIKQGDRFIIP